MAPASDPFDDLLTLEDTLYTSAHAQGVSDGARAGRIEGRIFGLEKGFEKFASLGELHGRGAVWGSRIATSKGDASSSSSSSAAAAAASASATATSPPLSAPTTTTTTTHPLPPLPTPPSTRLTTNISLLYHLTDPPTFSTANNEPSVADYDDRVKRAGAKAKVIERIVGETALLEGGGGASASARVGLDGQGEGEGKGGKGKEKGKGSKGDDNMEDFAGSRLIG